MSPDKPTSKVDLKQLSLDTVLAIARKALSKGDHGWLCDAGHFDRLRKDCEALGISPNTMSITVALREALNEIKVDELMRRNDESYSGIELGQTLYEAKWQSKRFSRSCYLKFALYEGTIQIELFTFHENKPMRRK